MCSFNVSFRVLTKGEIDYEIVYSAGASERNRTEHPEHRTEPIREGSRSVCLDHKNTRLSCRHIFLTPSGPISAALHCMGYVVCFNLVPRGADLVET